MHDAQLVVDLYDEQDKFCLSEFIKTPTNWLGFFLRRNTTGTLPFFTRLMYTFPHMSNQERGIPHHSVDAPRTNPVAEKKQPTEAEIHAAALEAAQQRVGRLTEATQANMAARTAGDARSIQSVVPPLVRGK